ncbi:hypothetical protein KL925_003897 [Ogataea polymorpha]|nr:hypothetical protein KL935_002611 [Ogataea polymorpha]KAG7926135.1 hypothetical protein KL925_003897 [Ogataea polymorpha]
MTRKAELKKSRSHTRDSQESSDPEVSRFDEDMADADFDSDDREEENAVLSRLAGNYRRFSESQNRIRQEESGEDEYSHDHYGYDEESEAQEDDEDLMRSLHGVLGANRSRTGAPLQLSLANALGSSSRPRESRGNTSGNAEENDGDQQDAESGMFRNALGRMFQGAGFGEMFGGVTRISELANALKEHEDPYMVLETLNELSERLLMINGILAERNLPTYRLAQAIVSVIENPLYQEDLEVQLVSCRCLYNLLEVNIDAVHDAVAAGAIEALQSKLLEISYIDLAEQALQTLEMISRDCGRDILMKNCLPACLMYLDFFTIHAQRKALSIAANSLKYVPKSKFDDIREVFPIIERVAIEYSDSTSVESAWLAISRVVKSFEKEPSLLESLISENLLKRLLTLLPTCLGKGSHSNNLISFNSCLKLIQSLSIIANSSPKLSLLLLENGELSRMILISLAGFDRNTSDTGPESSVPQVSVEALMATPKELILAMINLIAPILPFGEPDGDAQGKIDVGNFRGTNHSQDRIEMNKTRLSLYKDGDNIGKFETFVSDLLPLMINIYTSTVDYKVRRLVLLCMLRVVYASTKAQLVNLVQSCNVTSLLASIVIHGIHVLRKSDQCRSSTFEMRPYVLMYGALTITDILLLKAPEVFVAEFEREGLITHTQHFMNDLDQDERILKTLETQEDYMDEDKSEDERPKISSDERTQEEDPHNDEENSEDESNEDEEEPADTQSDDEELSTRLSTRFVRDYTLDSDGTSSITMESLLLELARLCKIFERDYKALKQTMPVFSSSQAVMLTEMKSIFDKSLSLSYQEWADVWRRFAETCGFLNSERHISSFELIASGMIASLSDLFRRELAEENSNCVKAFQHLICSSFSPLGNGEHLPLVYFVKKLEEALSRTESFEIISSGANCYASGVSGPASSMAKQIKIKLIPDDPEHGGRQLMLMVHAIATFKSINGFLKQRADGMRGLMRAITMPAQSAEGEAPYHIEFSINGEVIPHGTTIYGAIYRSFQNEFNDIVPSRKIWTSVPHEVHYRRVEGELPVYEEDLYPPEGSEDSLESLGDISTAQILELLQMLYTINSATQHPGATDTLFLNYKLTAKLNRQLEEPLIVASGTLPDWSVHITRQMPFLFPLDTRVFFLQSTSFGYSRLINLWQTRSNQDEEASGSGGNSASQLGRPVRHKLRLSRKKLLQGAIKVMDCYGTIPGVLEIEYFDEAGTGLGPTLEFYANVSKEFAKAKLNMWRTNGRTYFDSTSSSDSESEYVKFETGLFPRPNAKPSSKVLHLFSVLGKFVARSLLDSRIIDFEFNPLFFEIAKELDTKSRKNLSRKKSIERLSRVDADLAKSLSHLTRYLDAYAEVEESERSEILIDGCKLSDLSLNFTLPGYEDVELCLNGEEVEVDHTNLERYVDSVIDLTIKSGVRSQIQSFVQGFSAVFPYSSMTIFSSAELVKLLGNGEEDWSYETLASVIHADHGYSIDSPSVQRLMEIMSEFNADERRKFLQFLTGSPKLPIGGFKSLSPDFTVVLKHPEDGLKPDNYLPSVMTCANYLKLPDYSSKSVMKQRLQTAMTEGANSFLLS